MGENEKNKSVSMGNHGLGDAWRVTLILSIFRICVRFRILVHIANKKDRKHRILVNRNISTSIPSSYLLSGGGRL
jgi:hypothetical protein